MPCRHQKGNPCAACAAVMALPPTSFAKIEDFLKRESGRKNIKAKIVNHIKFKKESDVSNESNAPTAPATPTEGPVVQAVQTVTSQKRGSIRSRLKRQEPVTTSPEVQVQQEPAETKLEATAAWAAQVGKIIPTTEEQARALTEQARDFARVSDSNDVEVGLRVLAMRAATIDGKPTGKKQARAQNNGFGVLGFKGEYDWAASFGFVTQKPGRKGDKAEDYNLIRLSRATRGAEAQVRLLEGCGRGIDELLDPSARNALLRGSKKLTESVVSTILEKSAAGADVGKISAAVLAQVKNLTMTHAEETKVGKSTEELVAVAARKLRRLTRLANGNWSGYCAEAESWLSSARKRSLTPEAEKMLAAEEREAERAIKVMIQVLKGNPAQ